MLEDSYVPLQSNMLQLDVVETKQLYKYTVKLYGGYDRRNGERSFDRTGLKGLKAKVIVTEMIMTSLQFPKPDDCVYTFSRGFLYSNQDLPNITMGAPNELCQMLKLRGPASIQVRLQRQISTIAPTNDDTLDIICMLESIIEDSFLHSPNISFTNDNNFMVDDETLFDIPKKESPCKFTQSKLSPTFNVTTCVRNNKLTAFLCIYCSKKMMLEPVQLTELLEYCGQWTFHILLSGRMVQHSGAAYANGPERILIFDDVFESRGTRMARCRERDSKRTVNYPLNQLTVAPNQGIKARNVYQSRARSHNPTFHLNGFRELFDDIDLTTLESINNGITIINKVGCQWKKKMEHIGIKVREDGLLTVNAHCIDMDNILVNKMPASDVFCRPVNQFYITPDLTNWAFIICWYEGNQQMNEVADAYMTRLKQLYPDAPEPIRKDKLHIPCNDADLENIFKDLNEKGTRFVAVFSPWDNVRMNVSDAVTKFACKYNIRFQMMTEKIMRSENSTLNILDPMTSAIVKTYLRNGGVPFSIRHRDEDVNRWLSDQDVITCGILCQGVIVNRERRFYWSGVINDKHHDKYSTFTFETYNDFLEEFDRVLKETCRMRNPIHKLLLFIETERARDADEIFPALLSIINPPDRSRYLKEVIIIRFDSFTREKFIDISEDARDANFNIVAGTVVDRPMCTDNQFLIRAKPTILGCCGMNRYTVIHNSSRIPINEIEHLVCALAYAHDGSLGASPAPLVIAYSDFKVTREKILAKPALDRMMTRFGQINL